jgi:hypothetical protein
MIDRKSGGSGRTELLQPLKEQDFRLLRQHLSPDHRLMPPAAAAAPVRQSDPLLTIADAIHTLAWATTAASLLLCIAVWPNPYYATAAKP